MSRVQWMLAGLAALLIVVLFWLLLWSPMNEDIEDVRAETEDIEASQQQAAGRIAALEAVREEAPQQEALLVASHALVPNESALPGFLRQVQQAADESGLVLQMVTPERPSLVEESEVEGLHQIAVTLELNGSYFQLVDFLRRVEDPEITPRAILWNALTISGEPEDHPSLDMGLQGNLFAVLPTTPPESDVPEDEEEEDEDADDEDADVEVEIEENDE